MLSGTVVPHDYAGVMSECSGHWIDLSALVQGAGVTGLFASVISCDGFPGVGKCWQEVKLYAFGLVVTTSNYSLFRSEFHFIFVIDGFRMSFGSWCYR